jgi:uncharacterized DUF497 family protein
MKCIFDPAKDKSNKEKHGLSLDDAKLLEWDEALSWIDSRRDYGEVRYVSLIPMKRRLYCVVYVDAKVNRRIISLRKANLREIDKYEEEVD